MAKAIIDVEINDSAWKTFNKQVEAHRKALAQMPGEWGAVGKAVQKVVNSGAKFTATIQAQVKAFKQANTLAGKLTVTLKASDRITTSLARNTMNFARHIKDATRSILSWGSIMGLFSGLLGAGGLFGIARLASHISSGAAGAMGSGSSYGGEKSAEISYGQVLGGSGGVQSLLNRIAQEQHSGGVMFGRLGMGRSQWQGKQASDVLGPLLEAMQHAYRNAPKGAEKQAMEALAPGMDFNTLMRINAMNIGSLQQQYTARKRELELSSGTQSAYQRFERALDSAGEKLQNLIANAIVPLLPALEQFTRGLLKAIGMILHNPMIKGLVAGAGKALEAGAAYVLSDQFSSDFKSFMATMVKIGDAVVTTAEFLNKWLGSDSTPATNGANQMQGFLGSNSFGGTLMPVIPGGGREGGNAGQFIHNKVDVQVNIHQPAGANLITGAQAVAARGR